MNLSWNSVLSGLGHDVVAELDDPTDLVAVVDACDPDIVVVDIRMPPTHTTEGLEAVVEQRRLQPEREHQQHLFQGGSVPRGRDAPSRPGGADLPGPCAGLTGSTGPTGVTGWNRRLGSGIRRSQRCGSGLSSDCGLRSAILARCRYAS